MAGDPAGCETSLNQTLVESGRAGVGSAPGYWIHVAALAFVLVATLGAVFGGPAMGDHEALVAQCAREMRQSGDWIVPRYLGEPYPRKPPLPYWLIAAFSYVFPDDARTGLPVTTMVARLPSALAAMGTVLLLWKLAAVMFNGLIGGVTAVVAASSLFFLLYAPNATVEMLLTFCCTWAYVHFWFAIHRPLRSWPRRIHLVLFYIALGLGMMAKGPFPLVMVAMPIAVWWYTARPLGMIAEGGLRAWRPALAAFLRDLGPRTRQAVTDLWLVPGLVVFALCFVPWMVAVGNRHPDTWDLWNWQYWQRAQGRYEDTRPRGFFYYLPIIPGLIVPWVFLVFEAAAAPWLARYARNRKALLYAGLWTLVGAVVMSAMSFKKPYYIAPVIPGLVLLLGVVAERFYINGLSIPPRWRRAIWPALLLAGTGAVIGGHVWLRKEMPETAGVLTAVAAATVALLILATWAFVAGRRWTAFMLTAGTSVAAFMIVWYGAGRMIEDMDNVVELDQLLTTHGITNDDKVMWVERRPDSRLSFYFNRRTRQMIQPDEIVRAFPDRTIAKGDIEALVIGRALDLLRGAEPVYLVLSRKEYDRAQKAGLGAGMHLVGAARDRHSARSDWLVISNVAARRPE